VKKEQERLGITIAKLNDEKKKQQEHVEKIFFMLNQVKPLRIYTYIFSKRCVDIFSGKRFLVFISFSQSSKK